MKLLCSKKKEKITEKAVEKCARSSLKEKTGELHRSIQGFFTDHDRWMLTDLLDMVHVLEKKIETYDLRLASMMKEHEETLERLDQIPGVNEVGARGILAIAGPDLETFPADDNFCSWAGLCPGNNQSAGKRKSGKSPVQKHPLKTLLMELAWAATRKKNSFYREKFFRLKFRIGPKPAIVAVAHKMGKAIFHIIKDKTDYIELGKDYLDKLNRKAKIKRLESSAKTMGFALMPLAQ
jgi:transposase